MDCPNTILSEISDYLAAWDIQPTSIELASHSENIVYKVSTEDGSKYALRVHRPGYHTIAELNSEQMWTDALLQYGLLVPKAYSTTEGNYYITAECGGCERLLGLIGWLEGQQLAAIVPPDGEGEFPLQLIRKAGAICAQFHNQASGWQPPPRYTRHSLNIEGLLGDAPFWGRFWEVPSLTSAERRTICSLRQNIAERLSDYGEPARTFSMIHTDMHEENLLVTDDSLMVIDFDDSGFGWHQYDLAVMLFSFSERSDFDAIRQAVIAGYRTERDLDDEDLSLLEMFILIRTLALIGWADARPELGRDEYLPFLIDKACRSKL